MTFTVPCCVQVMLGKEPAEQKYFQRFKPLPIRQENGPGTANDSDTGDRKRQVRPFITLAEAGQSRGARATERALFSEQERNIKASAD